VIGTTFAPPAASATAWMHSATSSASAISAIPQPAERSGRITARSAGVRMSADSAMKCTPQKTMYFALVWAACRESLRLSPVRSAKRKTSSRW